MKRSPSVGQSGDTGEGKTGDGGVATKPEDDELGDEELKDDVKVELGADEDERLEELSEDVKVELEPEGDVAADAEFGLDSIP